jgi:hypothetical protein
MSITAFMTLLGAVVSLGSWLLIGSRMTSSKNPPSFQIQMLQKFFLYIGIFCFVMFLPQLALNFNPSIFPISMAWGYVVGHVFIYISFLYTLRLTCSMIPKLVNKQKIAIYTGIILTIAITIITAVTMIWGTQPSYDFEKHVILFNAHPIVGASIGLFAAISVLPASILLIRNGIRNPQLRTRSFLLGIGFFIIMTAGPLHDTATSWQFYLLADILSSVGFLVLAAGVMYRFEERIVPLSSVKNKLRSAELGISR